MCLSQLKKLQLNTDKKYIRIAYKYAYKYKVSDILLLINRKQNSFDYSYCFHKL